MKEERPKSKTLSIQDRDFLERLEHLATEAAHVRALALKVAEKISLENQAEFYLESICGPPEAKGTLLWVACGIENSPLLRSKQHLQILWHSLGALIAAQFSGFSLDDQEAIREVISTLIPAKEGDSFRASLESYWRPEFKDTSILFSRVFALLSLYSIVLPRLSKSHSPSGPDDSAIRDTAFRQAAQLLMHVREMKFGSTDEVGRLVWNVTLWKLSLNLYQLVGHFAASLPEAEKETLPGDCSETLTLKLEALEEKLRNQLAVILQLETASPFVVADIVGVLGGRYLNPGAEVEPAHSVLYTRAAEYVLKQCGSWQAPKDLKDDLQDPLVERYSPLAYLLDLPNPMLMPCLEALADAAGDALGSLKRELASYQIKLPRGGENVKVKGMQVAGAIYNGLMVGAAVSERMKDLLSDVELDELGAKLPEKLLDWDSLSDSLGFKQNLSEGVIKPWIERSEMRPGAILVFGPPGTGKTTIAKTLLGKLIQGLRRGPGGGANEGWRFLALSPADFARQGSDLVIAAAENLFRRLQRVRRCVVLLDEMEEFLRARGPETNRESRLITTAFLPLLQETVSKREIILIVATNFVGTIDQAVTRRGRFDLILPLGPPDEDSRRPIISNAVKHWPEQLRPWSEKDEEETKGKRLALIVHYTMGYTQPEIRDYMQELRRAQEKRPTNVSPQIPESELWRIRQERVPMALSGNPGCNWRTFRDEAARFKRPAITEETQDEKYWEEPGLPRL
jgi:DNA polymerase III delta prime subunit